MKKRLFRIIKIAGGLIGLTALMAAVMNLKMTSIVCRNQHGECSEVVREKLDGLSGCGYLACKQSIKRILKEEPRVSEYSYQLKGFSTLEVLAEEESASFFLKNENQNWNAQVAKNGMVLEITENSNLPSLSTAEPLPNPGQKVPEEVMFALELVAGMDTLYDIEVAKIENDYLAVGLKDGYRIISPLSGDRDFLLGATVLILNELNKEEMDSKISFSELKTVDLRFKNPVLK